MLRKIIRFIISTMGLLLGYAIADLLVENDVLPINSNVWTIASHVVLMVVFALLMYIIAPFIINKIEKMVDKLEVFLLKQPKEKLLVGLAGFIFGIIIAFLLSLPLTIFRLPTILESISTILSILIYIVLGALGYRMAIKNTDEIVKFFNKNIKKNKTSSKGDLEVPVGDKNFYGVSNKLLDTSVLIDGRIEYIAETGFLEGEIIIPNFVLKELQTLADSADDLKRERGRRGLDIVNKLKDSKMISVKISKKDYTDTDEVDIKLLKYANETGYAILTNDFNLNKLAHVQGIKVLNINELSNSVKTIVIPGERMHVTIISEGKERAQGLAYLEDGTMIVVEDGKNLIGQDVEVMVNKVLQTSAGKMIFTKLTNV